MPHSGVPFRAIADSTYDWEIWVDGAGTVRWVNPAVERFTGYDPDACLALEGFPLSVVHEDDRARMAQLLEGAQRGSSGNDLEFRVRHRDGSVRWAAISWQPLVDEDGARRGFRTSVRDIHERKQWEERLLAAERRAAQAAHDRTEFLASLSHELRSPLHCIAGFAELLGRDAADATQRRYAGIVAEQSRAVLRLVEDLLQFVAGERHPMALQREPFAISAVVSGEVEAASPRVAPGVTIRFEDALPPGFRVVGDADRLRQVVTNLVVNALRFTEQGTIVVRLGRGSDGRIALVVEDTGVGMSQELLRRVREPFVQGAVSTTESRGGVGLGLAIVDRIVAAMDGRFELTSAPGKGTRAEVVIPLPEASGLEVVQEEPLEPRIDGPFRVLVVDDSAAARELVVAMLREVGIEAEEAASGAEALRRAPSIAPDLVLLDYHMPDLDGVATAQLLRAEQAVSDRAALVLLTANVLAQRSPDAPLQGIDRVLTKPLRLAQLRALVRDVRAGTVRTPSSRVALDVEVVDELRSIRDASGRSLLARRGPALLAALDEAVRTLLAAGGADERIRAAHTLKGLAASLGAVELSERAAAIERDPEGASDPGSRPVAALRDALGGARRALERLIAEDGG